GERARRRKARPPGSVGAGGVVGRHFADQGEALRRDRHPARAGPLAPPNGWPPRDGPPFPARSARATSLVARSPFVVAPRPIREHGPTHSPTSEEPTTLPAGQASAGQRAVG